MSRHLRDYTAAVYQLEHVIRLVPDGAWDHPSPCEGWTAREVAGHAMGVVANVAAKLGVRSPVDAFADVATIAGDDPIAAFRAIRTDVLAALDRPGALQVPVSSSLGEMSIDDYLGSLVGDATIHAWDIARATGVDERLDPQLVAVVWERMSVNGVPRTPGRFADEVRVDGVRVDGVRVDDHADAQERLLAFTGRRP